MTKSRRVLTVYTPELLEEMKQCYENGFTLLQIATKYHADKHVVSRRLKLIGVEIPRKRVPKESVKKDSRGHKIRTTRLYQIWKNMRARCYNKSNKRYKHYGGKGIVLCDEWQKFENFYYWSLNNGYDDALSIDRIENSKNYCPENCRWADAKTQANNHTDNHFLTFRGETLTLSQWADRMHVHQTVVWKRLHRGWSVEKTLTTPLRVNKNGHYIKAVSTGLCE